MRRNSDADVHRIFQRDKFHGSDRGHLSTRVSGVHREFATTSDELNARDAGELREDLVGVLPHRAAKLQRRESITVTHRVGIRRAGIEALANHQHRLAMGRSARADPPDVGAERHVAGGLLPHEEELIIFAPDVGSTASDCVRAGRGIVFSGTAGRGLPDAARAREDSQIVCLR